MNSCPTAALVIIGQELLSGKVQDQNLGYLAGRLFGLGVEVKRVLFVTDATDDIVEALRWVYPRHDYVLTTGGMGPTHDDVTVAAVSQALERPMVHSPNLEKLLQSLYGLEAGPELTRMACIPEGSELFYPEGHRFPQLKVGNVYLFPGVPAIVRRKFEAIAEHFQGPAIHSAALELDRPEMEIVNPLNLVVEAFPEVRFGSYPLYHEGRESVRITLDSTRESKLAEALALLERLVNIPSA